LTTHCLRVSRNQSNFLEFAEDVPIRFLIFDKIQKRFITEQPIVAHTAGFMSHQFNAYEEEDGTIVADMMGYEPGQGESGYDALLVENLLKEDGGIRDSKLYRFRINAKTKSIQYENILADRETILAEFPAYNRDFMEKKYKFGYIVEYPYKAGSKISKIDLDARKIVASFAAPDSRSKDAVFREPWFVAKPGSKGEDDGVVLVAAGDIKTKTTTLYVLCGKTMKMIGQAEIPTFIPFGFHNRFYSYNDLGLKSNEETNTNQFCEGKGDKCST